MEKYERSISLRTIYLTLLRRTEAILIIFFPLALGGVIPWEEMPSLVITQVTLKTLYEIIVLPVTIRVVNFTKAHDQEDVFDNNITYNIFKVKDL